MIIPPQLLIKITLSVVQTKDKVDRKKSPASIIRFPNINQQLESEKDHNHLPAPPHHRPRQIQSTPPIAALPHHLTEEHERSKKRRQKSQYKRKVSKN